MDKGKYNYFIYTDGGARGNPGEAAYGFVILDSNSKIIYKEGKKIGIATNNVSEYSGVVASLKWIVENIKDENISIKISLDSNLVASQLRGQFKIKNENLRNLFFTAKTLEEKIHGKVDYFSIPREENKLADKMVNLALDSE